MRSRYLKTQNVLDWAKDIEKGCKEIISVPFLEWLYDIEIKNSPAYVSLYWKCLGKLELIQLLIYKIMSDQFGADENEEVWKAFAEIIFRDFEEQRHKITKMSSVLKNIRCQIGQLDLPGKTHILASIDEALYPEN